MSGTLGARQPPGRSVGTFSRIALGCGNFGGIGSAPEFFGKGLSEDQALALMDAAWQAGITHFDTADAYGGGRSELAIGRWIASRGVRPQLTTKTFNPVQAGADHGRYGSACGERRNAVVAYRPGRAAALEERSDGRWLQRTDRSGRQA